MLTLDANAALVVALENDFKVFDDQALCAPSLLWPEARSALHVNIHRGLVARSAAQDALTLLDSGVIEERRHPRLGAEAWRLADELGWAKTYDAEYLALATLSGAPLVTFDRRLRRAADRLGVLAGFWPET